MPSTPVILLPILATILLLGGCDSFSPSGGRPLDEGQRLEVTDYASEQPSSRAAYAALATLILPGGRLVIFDPGTGPDDPPRLIRSIKIPDRLTRDAQIDRDGFIWLATPDRQSVPLREGYVIDPHTATVHRVLELPEDVRAGAAVIVGSEYVYIRAWRDGFSGGIGVVDRRCAFDASRCAVRLFTELGDVSYSNEYAFHLTEEALYSFNVLADGRGVDPALFQIDPRTGEILDTSPFAGGSFSFDDTTFYVNDYPAPGISSVLRIDKAALMIRAEGEVTTDWNWLAVEGDRLYLAESSAVPGIEVRSSKTLEVLDTLDISAAGAPTAVFGFVAPGVLLLNHTAYLDTTTGEVVPNAFPLEAAFSFGLRLPEGHPLAY